jgi:hypothetical protein
MDNGVFDTFDFANGEHDRCFSPGFNSDYRLCSAGSFAEGWINIEPEIYNGSHWVAAPLFDSRCTQWAGPYSAEYLACEVALPPKQG